MREGYEICGAEDLSQKAKLVYLYLKQRSGKNGMAWPGIKTVAKDLAMSESSVRRAIRELEKEKLIEVSPAFRKDGGRTSNRYFLNQNSDKGVL